MRLRRSWSAKCANATFTKHAQKRPCHPTPSRVARACASHKKVSIINLCIRIFFCYNSLDTQTICFQALHETCLIISAATRTSARCQGRQYTFARTVARLSTTFAGTSLAKVEVRMACVEAIAMEVHQMFRYAPPSHQAPSQVTNHLLLPLRRSNKSPRNPPRKLSWLKIRKLQRTLTFL